MVTSSFKVSTNRSSVTVNTFHNQLFAYHNYIVIDFNWMHDPLNALNRTNIADISNQFNDSRNLRKVCGILGTIKLIDVKYLVVATHREFVGVIDNQVIWRLAGHDLIPFTSTAHSLTDTQVSPRHRLIQVLMIFIR